LILGCVTDTPDDSSYLDRLDSDEFAHLEAEARDLGLEAHVSVEDPGSLHLRDHGLRSPGRLDPLLDREVRHPVVVESDEVPGHVSSSTRVAPWPSSTCSTNGNRPIRHRPPRFTVRGVEGFVPVEVGQARRT
jgi:hypothetical protein